MADAQQKVSLAERVSLSLARHATLVFVSSFIVTGLLAVPFVTMQPTSFASPEPTGEVFEARDLIGERFSTSVYRPVFIVEAVDGNILSRRSLRALLSSERALRDDPEVSKNLVTRYEPSVRGEIKGLVTIADGVDAMLRATAKVGLDEATEAQVEQAVSFMLSKQSPRAFALSVEATRDEESGTWSAPALMSYVYIDNDALGGGSAAGALGGSDTRKEEFARAVQSLLRGDGEDLYVWGLAIDPNMTSAEQGQLAGPFIGLTILAVLLLMGLTFRSYWAVALTGAGLGALIIWLKGVSNLVGLERDQILSTIVPIAMVSFGADFAFHAIGRYREELAETGVSHRRAFEVGLAGVFGALVVAMASDSSAFLSNSTTGIDSLVQFGLAATIATVASFIVLGLVMPLAMMRVEQRRGTGPTTLVGKLLGIAAGLAASSMAVAAVIVSVFVSAPLGVGLYAGYLVLFLALPLLVFGRRKVEQSGQVTVSAGIGGGVIGTIVAALAQARWIVLSVVLVVTAAAAWGANNVRATFDVRDFFADTTDFVVGLERFERHVGDQGGEPALIYIEADLTNVEVLRALQDKIETLRDIESSRLARGDDGRVDVHCGLCTLLERALASTRARELVEQREGVILTDEDGDGIPDDAEQIRALLRVARREGVPGDGGEQLLSADDVRSSAWLASDANAGDGPATATQILLRIPGSGGQESLVEARSTLQPLVAELTRELREHDPEARSVLTGAPIVRQATLDAVLWAFRISIPVAVALCFIVAAVFMRSLRFAAVSTVPVVLVAAWLYGLMYAMGYAVNVVTATIGAISIGIGIDFSVHVTMRFREELQRRRDRIEALRAAGAGTGSALAASALSSVVGFSILAFAPMPMFASYGLLTAMMILMAFSASLLVLPSLLMLVTPRTNDK